VKTGAIPSGLDSVLRHQPVLPPGPGTGRVDQTAHAHALLETVALGAHQDQESAGTGREPEVGDSTRLQQQQLLADVQNPGDQPGHFNAWLREQGLLSVKDLWCKAQGYTAQKKRGKLRRACQLFEPPTADPHGGWCGGWELETPGYPIGRPQRGRHTSLTSRTVPPSALHWLLQVPP